MLVESSILAGEKTEFGTLEVKLQVVISKAGTHLPVLCKYLGWAGLGWAVVTSLDTPAGFE